MKFYITYPKQKPGITFETFEAKEYREAFQHAADNANGWGFSIASESSAAYVVRLNGEAVFCTDCENFANRVKNEIILENARDKARNKADSKIVVSVEYRI